jgi:hypothetical protein
MSGIKYDLGRCVRPTIAPLTAAIGLSLASAQLQAATITVNNLSDGSMAGQCTLRDAIAAANSDAVVAGCSAGSGADEIVFAPAIHGGTISLTGGPLVIGSNLTIAGPGREQLAIDGNGDRILINSAGGLAIGLSGITLQNGFTNAFPGGSAIYFFDAVTTLTDCVVSGNLTQPEPMSSLVGGAVVSRGMGQQLNISNCLFSNNAVTGPDDAPPPALLAGGAVHAHGGSIQIENSQFVDNQSGLTAGALAIFQTTGVVGQITDTLFENNLAGLGGAVGLFESAQADFDNVRLQNNLADFAGAMAVAGDSEAGIFNSVISGNLANAAGGLLVGLELGSSTASLGPTEARGLPVEALIGPGFVYMDDSLVRQNTAEFIGGGVLSKYASEFTAQQTRFERNTVPGMVSGEGSEPFGAGGALALIDAGASIDNSRFDRNEAPMGGAIQMGLPSKYDDDEIILARDRGLTLPPILALNRSQLTNNTASTYGGAIAAFGESITSIKYSEFRNNQAMAGGAMMLYEADGIVKYSQFHDHIAEEFGGTFATTTDCGLALAHVTISNSQAKAGGAVGNANCNLGLQYSTLSDNQASQAGGAIFSVPKYEAGLGLYMRNSTITNNHAPFAGGVLATSVELDFVTISHNQSTGIEDDEPGLLSRGSLEGAENAGGLILIDNADIEITNSIIAANQGPEEPLDLTVIASGPGTLGVIEPPPPTQTMNFSLVQAPGSEIPAGSDNLLNQDPLLGPLVNNGGTTLTRAPAAESPVIDMADPLITEPDYDQRGIPWPRVWGGRADMGALESSVDGIFHDRFEPAG